MKSDSKYKPINWENVSLRILDMRRNQRERDRAFNTRRDFDLYYFDTRFIRSEAMHITFGMAKAIAKHGIQIGFFDRVTIGIDGQKILEFKWTGNK